MSMLVAVMCIYTVRADVGGVRRTQRKLNPRGDPHTRRQRSAAKVYSQRLLYAGSRRNRTFSTIPYTGFLL